jgi:hypothetical protein
MTGDPNFLWDTTNVAHYIGKVTNDPTAPATGFMDLYVRQRAGRLNISFNEAGGIEQHAQAALWKKQIAAYYPTSSTNGGTATLGGYGISWTAGGTVSHPTPAAGIVTQSLRTRYANVVTTTNQTLGIISKAAGLPRYTRGNAAGRGGFFMAVRYVIELWPANTCRIFCGMSDSSTAQVTLDIASMTGNFAAFAHDTTDGANVLWFITRDNTTTNKTSLAGMNIAAGQAYDFVIYCKPNDSTIYYGVYDVNAGTWIIESSTTTNLPVNTAFMGPEITMSNGTANTTVTTVAPSIVRAIIESDY